jgi:hypothetical protein
MSGTIIAYHVTTVSTVLFGVGSDPKAGPGSAALAERMAEFGGVLGLVYSVQFIWQDRFCLQSDSVQPRSRIKRVLSHVRTAAFDGALRAAWYYGPALLVYSYGRDALINVVPDTDQSGAVVCAAIAKVVYGIAAFLSALYVYLYVQDLSSMSGNHQGMLSFLPGSIINSILGYPMVLAALSGPAVFFFLEDLGADDIGPRDVAAGFLSFVQSPLTWVTTIGSEGLASASGAASATIAMDASLSSMLDAAALGLLISTVTLVSWSMCYKLAEIVWTQVQPPPAFISAIARSLGALTPRLPFVLPFCVLVQPPDKLPKDADLVATLQTDLDDASLAPARHLAFAVLNRRLMSTDRSCASLFSRRSRNPDEKSHWENIVEVCIKVNTSENGGGGAVCHPIPSHLFGFQFLSFSLSATLIQP